MALAGGAYRGVGVPNCLESGEKAVAKVLGEWGIALAEDAEATEPTALTSKVGARWPRPNRRDERLT